MGHDCIPVTQKGSCMAEENVGSDVETQQQAADTAVEKPKRARRKKSEPKDEGADTVSAPEADEKPKRATRARKTTRATSSEDATEAPKESSPKNGDAAVVQEDLFSLMSAEPGAEAVEQKPKRRRGRPRKTDAQPDEKTAPRIEDLNETIQNATKASSVPMGAPAATLAEADGAAATEPSHGHSSHKEASARDQDVRQDGDGRRRRRRGKSDSSDGSTANGGNGTSQRQGRNQRRRNRKGQQVQNLEPSLSREELAEMKVAELRVKAAELGVDHVGVRKKDLAEAIYQAAALAEGFRPVSGVLDFQNEGYAFLRTGNYMPGDNDAFVHQQLIRQFGLRPGDYVVGSVAPSKSGNKFPPLHKIDSVNGRAPEEMKSRPRFRDLTPIYPNERLVMEHGKESTTGRAIDLVAPIGKGQRGLIVSPPKAGKTTILKRICQSIAANNPEVHLFCLLVDERPEEVTDMERSIKGEVVSSTFDMPASNHTAVAELVIERAKRLVELGEDVVVVLDSITRLARAYNLAQPASGRILSGGVDSAALYPPKKFLGAARNIENGGSLTILASALIDTGSKMDEVIFEEFKGTGNMELKLDRDLADRRIFPAIDPVASGTRNEELLISAELQPFVWGIRRILANMNNTERAASALVKGLKSTDNNEEFLIRSAKKAQQNDHFGTLH
ncbi:MAG: transcription termination factor Rho [Olsenella sp.]|nr:transcription termination factor Rho [Olsenella sp.]